MAISSTGAPVLARAILDAEDEEHRNVVEESALRLRFEPALNQEKAVPVSITVRIPLAVDFDPAQVLELADVDEKPKATTRVVPLYPYWMQKSKTSGRVVVEAVLLPDGSLRNVRVIKSTHEDFELPAMIAVKESVWEPAKKNGYPQACRVRVPVEFIP